jgi:hypothetical protein
MAMNIFDDPEMFEEVMQISEEVKLRAENENKDEIEVINEMEKEIFDDIKEMMMEEIEYNKKIEFSEKYLEISENVGKVNVAAIFLYHEKLMNREEKKRIFA